MININCCLLKTKNNLIALNNIYTLDKLNNKLFKKISYKMRVIYNEGFEDEYFKFYSNYITYIGSDVRITIVINNINTKFRVQT